MNQAYLKVRSQPIPLIGHLLLHLQGNIIQLQFSMRCLVASLSQLEAGTHRYTYVQTQTHTHTHTHTPDTEGGERSEGVTLPHHTFTCSLIALSSSSWSLAFCCTPCCTSEQEIESSDHQVNTLLRAHSFKPQTLSSCSTTGPPLSLRRPESVPSGLASVVGAARGGVGVGTL